MAFIMNSAEEEPRRRPPPPAAAASVNHPFIGDANSQALNNPGTDLNNFCEDFDAAMAAAGSLIISFSAVSGFVQCLELRH